VAVQAHSHETHDRSSHHARGNRAAPDRAGRHQARESFELIGRAASYATALPPNDPPRWTEILTTVFTPKVERPIMNERSRQRPA
jgi:hypothetical protein